MVATRPSWFSTLALIDSMGTVVALAVDLVDKDNLHRMLVSGEDQDRWTLTDLEGTNTLACVF